MSAVLYDEPGPRARVRGRVLGAVTLVVAAASVGWVGYLLVSTDQFSSARLAQLQYAQIQRDLARGYAATLTAAGIATVLALALGAVLAAGRMSEHALLRRPAGAVVELFRGIPLLILIFFFYYGSLEYGLGLTPLWSVVLGLTLYNGSVLAEILRSGVASVPRGQAEAAYALGLRKTQVMTSVLLPQAVRSMLPAIVSQIVVLLKDTALGFIVTYDELLYVAKQIGGRQAFDFPYVVTYLVVAAIYVLTCLLLSLLANQLEQRTRRSPRAVRALLPQPAGD
jgi:glutamate transport system permease protein